MLFKATGYLKSVREPQRMHTERSGAISICWYICLYTSFRFYFPTLKSGNEDTISSDCFPEKTWTDTNTWPFWTTFRSRHHLSHFGALSPPHDKMAACPTACCPLQTHHTSFSLVPSAPSHWLQEHCLHLPAGPALGFNIGKVKKSIGQNDTSLWLPRLLFEDVEFGEAAVKKKVPFLLLPQLQCCRLGQYFLWVWAWFCPKGCALAFRRCQIRSV